MEKGTILYIGTFQLPDKCAAAHRVLSISKSLRDFGYEVVLFGVGEDTTQTEAKVADGFVYYDIFKQKRGEHAKEMFNIGHIKAFAHENPDLKAIIAYNYPSIALLRLRSFCAKRGIRLLADCTEWFDGRGRGLIAGLAKRFDTALRMRYVHKHVDGIIAISNYLYEFYHQAVPTICIPPTVDLSTGLYNRDEKTEHDKKVFIYAGTPSNSKEALNCVIDCFNELQDENIELIIAGITDAQYRNIYKNEPNRNNIRFLGRLSRAESLNVVKQSDYALIIRPDSRLTNAGFPTKFSEAISCGIPVIATNTSDLSMYLDGINNGCIVDKENLIGSIQEIINGNISYTVKKDTFDYHRYDPKVADFLDMVGL